MKKMLFLLLVLIGGCVSCVQHPQGIVVGTPQPIGMDFGPFQPDMGQEGLVLGPNLGPDQHLVGGQVVTLVPQGGARVDSLYGRINASSAYASPQLQVPTRQLSSQRVLVGTEVGRLKVLLWSNSLSFSEQNDEQQRLEKTVLAAIAAGVPNEELNRVAQEHLVQRGLKDHAVERPCLRDGKPEKGYYICFE